jgi:cell division protein FtsL
MSSLSVKNSRGAEESVVEPVIRMRSIFIGICVLVVCIAGPLVLVWKQSYINKVSIRHNGKVEALAVLNREIAALRVESVRLSSNDRLERIARSRGLDYPALAQLEVIEVSAPRRGKEKRISELLARIGRSRSGKN